MTFPLWAIKLLAEAAACLALFGIGYWRGHESEAEKFAAFRQEIETQGLAAQARAAQEKAHHEQVAKQVEQAHLAAIGPAQDEAVRRYRALHPDAGLRACAGGGGMPVVAAGTGSADEAPGQPLADPAQGGGPDEPFVRACAADALTLQSWQAWATANGLPVN